MLQKDTISRLVTTSNHLMKNGDALVRDDAVDLTFDSRVSRDLPRFRL
jgi:hypothetical protein